MKLKETCHEPPKLPTFAELPEGAVYRSRSGKILQKINSGSAAYYIDPVAGILLASDQAHMVVVEVFPDATLVLKP